MERLFGTDGIRASAGRFPLDYPTVSRLGKHLIMLLRDEGLSTNVLIGRDTRESGIWLEQALMRGIKEAGGKAVSAGLIPTSAVSFLTKKHGFSAGIVISASHNPYGDNGIKIFSRSGMKVSEEWERAIEKGLYRPDGSVEPLEVKIEPDASLVRDYTNFLKSRFDQSGNFKRIKIVLDCSNGAGSFFAPQIFADLGFEVKAMGVSPNGRNINAGCGSLHPEKLAEAVVATKADIGIAYDGDADRALCVDERGKILNGDHTLYVIAKYMKDKGRLKSKTVVATTMSNMGLEKGMEKIGLSLSRTQVGDKYVLEQMIKIKSNLGGEQSGHTIFLDDCPTGDGILTSIKMLEAMTARRSSLAELVRDYREYPQVLKNVAVSRKEDFGKYPEILKAVEQVEQKLGLSGRMNVRYSGTEPLVRIMIEGEDRALIENHADHIAEVIAKHLA